MSRISQLTELTTPHDNDLLPIVDVSDTTQASSGSTKYIKVGNLPIQSGVVTDADLQAALPAPLAVEEGRVYTVQENQQVAFRFPIAVDGILRVDGILYEV